MAHPTITLLTDFGSHDTYVGQMKGVIAAIAPRTRVIDLTHEIPPGHILAGAIMLDSAVDAFAQGTIHVAVVDPGVGSARAAVAIKTESFIVVGPDNGIFSAVLQRFPAIAAHRLTNPAYHRIPVSATFHGRDLFAPAAAHLARGVAIQELGDRTTLVKLDLPAPELQAQAIIAHVVWVDHFGNLITDLTVQPFHKWLAGEHDAPRVAIEIAGHSIDGIHQTFADVKIGELIAYFGSSGRLEIAVRQGNAASMLGSAVKHVLISCRPELDRRP
jgi:hypothetical protein